MEKHDIEKLLEEAIALLKSANQNLKAYRVLKPGGARQTEITTAIRTALDYREVAEGIFGQCKSTGIVNLPGNAQTIISKVRKARKLSTLRKRATSVRLYSLTWIKRKLDMVEAAKYHGSWQGIERIVSSPTFISLVELSKMMPADYRNGWVPQSKRKSKKASLCNLPKNWRELMAKASVHGQFHIPMLSAMLTGARPEEIQRGITFIRMGDQLRVRIRGAKVKAEAGQPWRFFNVADHPIKDMLLAYMDTQPNKNKLVVRVGNKNSLTTYMRSIGKKLWPDRKEAITAYSARHAMASDCKLAIKNGADEDLASMVLGHCVDKTQSYYGNLSQSGGDSMAPTNLVVCRPVRNKQKLKNSLRKLPGQINKAKVKNVR
ncbi:MAG TPA: hypothetical protein VIO56_01095 [Methylotenera sp.]|jgi:integrase